MTNEFIINLENQLRGMSTRLKELHFSASSITIHKLIDEFDSEFLSFEDEIMENAQALWGTIKPGDLEPIFPESMEFPELLEEIRGILAGIKKESENNMMWTGIINVVDGFWATVNKYVYLISLEKGIE